MIGIPAVLLTFVVFLKTILQFIKVLIERDIWAEGGRVMAIKVWVAGIIGFGKGWLYPPRPPPPHTEGQFPQIDAIFKVLMNYVSVQRLQ